MENRIRRPVSVWVGQVVMIGGAFLFLLAAGAISLMLATPIAVPIFLLIIAIAMYLGLAGLFVAAFVGMTRRKQWGRWLAVGVLSLVMFFGLLGLIGQASGPYNRFDYANSTEAAAGFMTGVFILGLMLWLTLSLAFGKRARSFFSGQALEAPPQIVP